MDDHIDSIIWNLEKMAIDNKEKIDNNEVINNIDEINNMLKKINISGSIADEVKDNVTTFLFEKTPGEKSSDFCMAKCVEVKQEITYKDILIIIGRTLLNKKRCYVIQNNEMPKYIY